MKKFHKCFLCILLVCALPLTPIKGNAHILTNSYINNILVANPNIGIGFSHKPVKILSDSGITTAALDLAKEIPSFAIEPKQDNSRLSNIFKCLKTFLYNIIIKVSTSISLLQHSYLHHTLLKKCPIGNNIHRLNVACFLLGTLLLCSFH